MNTYNRSISSPSSDTLVRRPGKATQELMSLGRRFGWEFVILGSALFPERPVRLDNWLVVPAQEDPTPVPVRTMERIQAIYAAGIRPKGFVVVHEAPRYLAAPPQSKTTTLLLPTPRAEKTIPQPQPEPITPEKKPQKSQATEVISALGTIVKVVGMLVGSLVFFIFPAMLVGLAAIDPIVIAVMDDDSWVEIDRWYIE